MLADNTKWLFIAQVKELLKVVHGVAGGIIKPYFYTEDALEKVVKIKAPNWRMNVTRTSASVQSS